MVHNVGVCGRAGLLNLRLVRVLALRKITESYEDTAAPPDANTLLAAGLHAQFLPHNFLHESVVNTKPSHSKPVS